MTYRQASRKTRRELVPSRLTIGDSVLVELAGKGENFLGLGAISRGDVMLRSGRRPMFVEIRNPFAVELLNYRVTHCEAPPKQILLRFSMEAREGGPMEWMVHEVRPRYNTADWTPGSKTRTGYHPRARASPRAANRLAVAITPGFSLSLSLSKRRRFRSTRFWTAGPGKSGAAHSATSSGCGTASCLQSAESNQRRNFTRPNGTFPIVRTRARFSLSPSKPSSRVSPSRHHPLRAPRHLGFRGSAHQVAL